MEACLYQAFPMPASAGEVVLTLKQLREHFHYDPLTGHWTRLRACGPHLPGSKVGAAVRDREGHRYNILVFNGARYKMSRLAVFYMRGAWPTGVVDHRNGNTVDDAWKNLRDCSRKQNSQNRRLNANSRSRHKGVQWNSRRGRWVALIRVNGKRLFLGYFEDPAAGALAYKAAALKHFGEFARA